MSRYQFDGKIVAITGGAGGLGQALAHQFGQAGGIIVAIDYDEAALTTLRQNMQEAGITCHTYTADVTDPAAVQRAASTLLAETGGVDVLINNAGISHRSLFAKTNSNVIKKVLAVSVLGAVYWTEALLPSLLARQGLIIVMSSVAGFAPLVGRTGYAAAKHALRGFFESLRVETKSAGLRIMMVYPAFIQTNIDRNALRGDGHKAGDEAKPTIGKALSPEKAAEAIFKGARTGKTRLLVGNTAKVAWWAHKLAPGLYARMMYRQLKGEFDA